MPRMSEAEKQRSHARILDAAASLLREKGIEATSVGDIMQAAGMTHGGFYRHFDSKSSLVADAFRHAVDGVVGEMESAETEAERTGAREAYINQYLSAKHVTRRGTGCPLASLAAGLARDESPAFGVAAETVGRMAGLLDESGTESNQQGMAVMALLLGTVALARLSRNDVDLADMLQAGKRGVQLLHERWDSPAVDKQPLKDAK